MLWCGMQNHGSRVSTLTGAGSARFARAAGPLRLALSRDGLMAAIYGSDQEIGLWSVENGRSLGVLSEESSAISEVSFSPDGSRIVAVAWRRLATSTPRTPSSNYAVVWDVGTRSVVARIDHEGRALLSAVFSSNGTRILTVSDNQRPQIWNAARGNLIATLGTEDSNSFRAMQAVFSPDSKLVAASCNDQTVKLWNAETGQFVASLPTSDFNAISFSPDSTLLISSKGDAGEVWDYKVGRRIAVLSGHSGKIDTVAFSPNGSRIITMSEDLTGHLWDSTRLTQPWLNLAFDACTRHLGPNRGFDQAEIDGDSLLRTEWNDPNRDVCEKVEGVAPRPGYSPHHHPTWVPQFAVDFVNKHWP